MNSFPDCNPGAYYYNAVRWACSSNVGIASGYENGNFGPTDLVSNQDLLTFLYRFACYCGYITNSSSAQTNYRTAFEQSVLSYPNTFWDYSIVPVGWAYQTGFITNYTIKGTTSATRGDTAKYIYHFYKRYQKKYGLVVIDSWGMEWAEECALEIEDFLNGFIGQLVGGEFDSSTDNSIMATGNSNLAGTNRIKVLGACRYDEQSFRGDENATKEWCLGAGYDSSFNPYDEEESPDPLKADYNSDNRISLYELYYYSYNEVLKRVYQHIVHYPSGDQYIIYEDHF